MQIKPYFLNQILYAELGGFRYLTKIPKRSGPAKFLDLFRKPVLDETYDLVAYKELGNKIKECIFKTTLNFKQKTQWAKLSLSDKLSRILKLIESDMSKSAVFYKKLKEILKHYNLDIKDIFGSFDLIFSQLDMPWNADNLKILKRIIVKNLPDLDQEKYRGELSKIELDIEKVSSRLKNILKEYAQNLQVYKKRGTWLYVEEISRDSDGTLNDEKALDFLIEELARNYIDGSKTLIEFLQKESSFSPSFIASNIGRFFPDKSEKVQKLWIKLLSYIKDPNDLTIDRSDFSSIPKLKQLFDQTDSVNHPSLLFLLKSHSSLANLAFPMSDDNKAFFNKIELGVPKILKDPKSLFEIYKFFRDNPNYSLENIEKIPVKVLSSLKAIFNRIDESQKSELYQIFSNFAKSNTMLSPNKHEELLLKPIKDDLDNYDFVHTLAKKMTNSRLVAQQGFLSVSNTLVSEVGMYQSKRDRLVEKLILTIIKAKDTKQGVLHRQEIEEFMLKIFQHFWYEGIIEPTVRQILDYVKNLQGISRRNFLKAVAFTGVGALASGGLGTWGVNQYREAQFQAYLAKKFDIKLSAIKNSEGLYYPQILLADLNKFLNSFMAANPVFNQKAKETIFGKGNLDIPQELTLPNNSIIVAKVPFVKQEFLPEVNDGILKGRRDIRFKSLVLKDILKQAGISNPDEKDSSGKTPYEKAKEFFSASIQKGDQTARQTRPFYPFINDKKELRIIVDPSAANLVFSPLRTIDELVNSLFDTNQQYDRDNKLKEAFKKNLEMTYKFNFLDDQANKVKPFINRHQELLNNPNNQTKQSIEENLNQLQAMLDNEFTKLLLIFKQQGVNNPKVEILKREWHETMRNHNDISNQSMAGFAKCLAPDLAESENLYNQAALEHNRGEFNKYGKIENLFTEEFIRNSANYITKDLLDNKEVIA
jgi:hypothetical protein